MHWKPKSKWLSNREGIDQQVHVEEFSSDDFQVEHLLGSCGYINVSRYTIGLGSFLLQVFGSLDVETSLPSFLKVSECKLHMETDSDLLILVYARNQGERVTHGRKGDKEESTPNSEFAFWKRN